MGDSRWNEAEKIRLDDPGLPDGERARKLRRADEAGMAPPPSHICYGTLFIELGWPVF